MVTLNVIMVTLNCLRYTQMTLGSFKTALPHNFVVVDNASTDDTHVLLDDLAEFANQRHVRNKTRVSLSQAWNQGLKLCLNDPEFKYAYVINNDIIFEPFCVDRLVKFVDEHPEYVLVSGLNTRDFKKHEEIGENMCDFSAFLITKACVEKVGFFDENFIGAFFEDNDYHTRVKKAGLKSCVVASVGFHHFGSRTLWEGLTPAEKSQRDKDYLHNQAYFRAKWGFLPE